MKKLPCFPRSRTISLLALAPILSVSLFAAAPGKGKHPYLSATAFTHQGAPAKASAHSHSVTTINIPGATVSYAFGVNNKGETVGYW